MKASLVQGGFSAVNSEKEIIYFKRYSTSIIIFKRKIIININPKGEFFIQTFEGVSCSKKIPVHDISIDRILIRKLDQYQHAQSSLAGALSELLKSAEKAKKKS